MPKLGVIGSMVWDVIHGRDAAAPPVEEWGGIAYALAGLDATLAAEWEIEPLIRVGRDMQTEANEFLRGLRRVGATARFIEVPVANNRVVLRYESRERRCERMEGGVPAWTWTDLGPLVRDLDAIYLNFISGFELCLGTAQALRHGFQGPIYADLHSLFLGMRHDGIRTLRPLPESDSWFRCFDVVQLNEDELGQLSMDPLAVAAEMLGAGVSLLVVTLGSEGAVYVAAPGFASLASLGPRHSLGDAVTTARVEAPTVEALDPTGCGDVFGAALCAGLLQGVEVESAIVEANRLAARNAAYRGASNLSGHLRGELVTAPVDG
jgi:sugar/nucleoside kinase (ribokinase family)